MAAADSGPLRGQPPIGIKVTLHLGVQVQPYRTGGKTTGDVADILEKKYGLFSVFYRVKQDVIATDIAKSLQSATEAMFMGRAVDPWGGATREIQKRFSRFITSREAERAGMAGVPTKAALAGVNHRLAHPYSKNNRRRPSFRDTGLLMTSFRAWVD